MHVITTSHNAYKWPRAAGFGESYGPMKCMVTCIRAFFGFSVFFGIVWAPYGPLRMSYGLVNTRMQTDRNQS